MKWKKYLYWIPVIVWMGVIFYFSHQPSQVSSSLSGGILDSLLALLPNGFPIDTEVLHTIIRKIAHVSVYFVLAILVSFAWSKSLLQFYQNPVGVHRFYSLRSYSIVIGICFLYAMGDEYHQTFISGRSGEFRDVLIDTSGALMGLFVYGLVYWWIFRKRVKQNDESI